MLGTPTVSIESAALAGAAVQLHELTGTEAIGRPFEFRVELVCTSPGECVEAFIDGEPVPSGGGAQHE